MVDRSTLTKGIFSNSSLKVHCFKPAFIAMSTSLPELLQVVDALNPLADKYFELGIQLGVKIQQLKSIESKGYTQSRCLIETISLWQNNNTGECSWSALAEAIEKTGGHNKLVTEIRARDMTKELIEDPRHDSTGHELAKDLRVHVAKGSEFLRRQQHDSTESADDTGYSSKSDSIQSEDSSGSEAECFELVPGCGCTNKKPCSLYTFCSGGCPNPTGKKVSVLRKKSKAPAQSEIPVEEEPDFEDYEESTKGIRKSFGNLVLETCRAFKKSSVNIQELSLYLQSTFPLMKTRAEDLNQAMCLDEVFKIVVDQACSWFDYEIIKDIIQRFGDSTAKRCITEYEAHFKKYAEQRLPKGMKHIEVGTVARRGGKQLVIKIDREWEEVTFSDLNKLRGTFASILGVRRKDLYLADIREGCIMLTFMIPQELAGRLFPSRSCLTSSQIKSLKDEGVISLMCGKLTWRAAGSTKDRDENRLEVRPKSKMVYID